MPAPAPLFILPATCIEIAPQDGYSTVLFQLGNAAGGDPSSGGTFTVQIVDASAFAVGAVYQVAVSP